MKLDAVCVSFCLAGMFGLAGCNSIAPRTLEAVTVNPSVADAKNFFNGEVHFVATATFTQPPTPVTPYQVSSWLTTPPSLATIDQNGVARCMPGQAGTATIEIALVGDGPLMNAAKLICP